MATKYKCSCGKKTCMKCGGKLPKANSGGWLDSYEDGGFVKDYSGQKFLEPTSNKLPSGYLPPSRYPSSELATSVGGENGEPAYLIPTFKYGQGLIDPYAEFRKTGEHLGGPFKTWQEADEWDRTIRHPYVEKGQDIPTPIKRVGKDYKYKEGGWLDEYHEGGELGHTHPQSENIDDISKFLYDYTNSKHFYNLSKGEGYNDNQILDRIKDINSFDPNRNIKYTPSGNSWVHAPDEQGHTVTLSQDMGDWPSYKDINAHELGHLGFDTEINPVIESTRQKMMRTNKSYQDYIKSGRKEMGEHEEHDIEPQENRADLFQLRYQLKEKGIYDSVKGGKFTKEHLEKFKNSGDWNRMQRLYKDEDIINLMNTVADKGAYKKTFTAKNGGWLDQLT